MASTPRIAGAELRRLRTAEGLSQRELAELLSVSQSTLARWESGGAEVRGRHAKRIHEVFQTDESTEVADAVLLVHGIRDHGEWQQMIRDVLEESESVKVFGCKYGYFDVARFLSPFETSRKPKEHVLRQLRRVKKMYPTARLTVLAHSFGTYLLTKILMENSDIELWRVILCGSVVKQSFRWDSVSDRIGGREDVEKRKYIVNDCGTRDIWPILGASAGWGYGPAGANGFGQVDVLDRFHCGGHSLFFQEAFVRKWWSPLFSLSTTTVSSGLATQREDMPKWLKPFELFPIRWALLVGVLLMLACLAYGMIPSPATTLTIVDGKFGERIIRPFSMTYRLTDDANADIKGSDGRVKLPPGLNTRRIVDARVLPVGISNSYSFDPHHQNLLGENKLVFRRVRTNFLISIRPIEPPKKYVRVSEEQWQSITKHDLDPKSVTLKIMNKATAGVDVLLWHYVPGEQPIFSPWGIPNRCRAGGSVTYKFGLRKGYYLAFGSTNGRAAEYLLQGSFYKSENPVLMITGGPDRLVAELRELGNKEPNK